MKLLIILNELTKLSDFRKSTWMAMGACLLLLCQTLIPSDHSKLIPFLYLGYRLARAIVETFYLYTLSYANLIRGRYTATLNDSEDVDAVDNSDAGVVLFLVGARINHPLGKLSPGTKAIGQALREMWQELDNNREKWGYLGRTEALVDCTDTERSPNIWLTYWKDLKGLHEFASSTLHRLGRENYNAKKFPYMGIMHETYFAPPGCWETIYEQFPPWGLGNAKYAKKQKNGQKLQSTIKPISKLSTMLERMGRKDIEE